MPPQLKLYNHFTKSRKHDNIYYFYLQMPEEDNCLILAFKHVLKLRYRAHPQKCKLLLHCTESLEHADIEIIG